MWVSGGLDHNQTILDTTESMNAAGVPSVEADLPVPMVHHCAVQVTGLGTQTFWGIWV